VPSAAAEIFRQAATINLTDQRRRGNCVQLGPGTEVIVTGDIHGNRPNLTKIINYAALAQNPDRRLVLQELTHGPIDPAAGHDRSIELVLRAARLKLQYPHQTLFVMANHDLAQVTGSEIVKNGRGVCRAFAEGVKFAFEDEGQEVLDAVIEFLRSLPLAVACPNGVLISHSLPDPGKMDEATIGVLHRPSRQDDLARGGAVYQWLWGRGQTDQQLKDLGQRLGVSFFVLGHRRMDAGYEVFGERAVAISSDDQAGCVLHFSTDAPLTAATVAQHVKQIAMLR